MLLTSVAVVAFHQRGNGSDPVWNSVIAPVLAFIALAFVTYKVLDSLDLLVGGTDRGELGLHRPGGILRRRCRHDRVRPDHLPPELYDEILED